jgi:alpha-L-fucosidase
VDTVSKNGTLLLNLSPKADGTFPPAIQTTLLEIGQWLGVNGEAIYDTHNWIKFSDGGGRGQKGLNIRFTVNGKNLYAIILGNWPGTEAVITSLATTNGLTGKIKRVSLLGSKEKLKFTQDANGLKVSLPATAPGKYAYVLKITGLKMNPPTWTKSGNPQL